MKRYVIILLIAISVAGSFLIFSNFTEAAPCGTTTCTNNYATCNNGTSKTSSGGCGTACVPLCSTSFASSNTSSCRSQANTTRPWGKYSAKRTTCTTRECNYIPYYYCYDCGPSTVSYSFSYFDKLCSTGDKCSASTCAAGGPTLRPGYCSCGSVGGSYKICCKKEGATYTPVKACKYHAQDDYSPEEGHCCGSGVETIRGTTCPSPPASNFTVDINASPTTINQGGSANIAWITAGATGCTVSAGVGSVATSGSRSVSPSTTTTYTLSCAKSDNPTERKSDSVTVTVTGTGCVISSFSAEPSSIDSGGSSTLSWSTSQATGCAISQGIGSVATSGSRSVSPASTTTYVLSCNATVGGGTCAGQATVSIGGGAGEDCDVPSPSSVSANVSATRVCLPFHPNGNNPSPEERQTRIIWSGSVQNKCSEIIGGGSPSNNNITCTSTSGNWSLNKSGTGSIGNSAGEGPYSPTSTQDYSIRCTRAAYTCSSSRTFEGNGGSNDNDCEASCTNLEANYSAISSCSCSRGSCDVSYTGHGNECPSNGSHIDPETGEVVLDYPESCTLCQYYEYNQSVRSKDMCSSTDTDSQTVRFIQEPGIPTNNLRTDPLKPQILLNQFINLIWNVTKPDSGTPTTLRCTPSIASGDGTGWAGALDSLASFGEKEGLSPKVTTNYQLDCRNRDDSDALHCYHDSDPARYEVKVFTVDLEEIPAFRNGFMNIVGRIGESFRKAFN